MPLLLTFFCHCYYFRIRSPAQFPLRPWLRLLPRTVAKPSGNRRDARGELGPEGPEPGLEQLEAGERGRDRSLPQPKPWASVAKPGAQRLQRPAQSGDR